MIFAQLVHPERSGDRIALLRARERLGLPSLRARLEAKARAGSLPGRTISTDGGPCSPSGQTLNPRFVEALMRWPAGWTWPFALTDSEHAEMVSCRPRPRGPSASSGPDFEEDR